jgi:hypothetical protein
MRFNAMCPEGAPESGTPCRDDIIPKRFVILAPLSGRILGWRVPRVETLGFYEADFVKTGGEYCFLFIFCSFWPTSGDSPPVWLWCLIIAAGVCAAAVIKR